MSSAEILIHNGSNKVDSVSCEIKKATVGQDVIEVKNLYKNTGMFTYDPGFMSTASCESRITYIDGDAGILTYRGYNIEELTEKSSFLEVSYLLLEGNLPKKAELDEFTSQIQYHSIVHEQLQFLYRGFARRSHPMATMMGATASLSAFYHDEHHDMHNSEFRDEAIIKLIAKMPTLAAMAYKYLVGEPFVYPEEHYNFSENFLHMLFHVPGRKYVVNPVIARAIDKILILHADHEQNASTSSVRLTGSTGTNLFAAVTSGIAALWGPAHGGANEEVITMLKQIGTKENIPEYIKRAKDKNDPFRLMGFGHRVYKNYDPRAKVLKRYCDEVFEELGIKRDPLLEIARELETIALNDDYFQERKLFPNVDFYSGIIYKAIGIPTELFTVLFAVARSVGWAAQWKEMLEDPEFRIGRPRQLYAGHVDRKYVNVDKRG